MRPVLLEMAGFGSFREPTTVDFREAEYFALVGPTGSGKSTVIDALTFALYGSVPRWDNARTVALALAPTVARGTVRFVFDVGVTDRRSAGPRWERYVVARELRRAANGGVSVRTARLERLHDPSGTGAVDEETEPVADGAPAVTKAVEDLLGLPFGDFTTCVVLPQGEFAEFLHTEPRKRQETLVRLLGLGVYDVIAKEANTEARNQEQRAQVLGEQLEGYGDATADAERSAAERVTELSAVRAAVDAAVPRLTGATAELAAAKESLQRLDADHALLISLAAPPELNELALRRRSVEGELTATRAAVDAAELADTAAREAVTAAPSRAVLELARRHHAELAGVVAELPGARERHTKSREADAAAGTDATAARDAVEGARMTRTAMAADLADAREAGSRLAAERDAVRAVIAPAGLDALDSRRSAATATLARAAASLTEAESADAAARAALAAAPERAPLEQARRDRRDLDIAHSAHTSALAAVEAAGTALAAATTRVTQAAAHLEHARARRAVSLRADLAAALRPGLVAGEDCPVCAQVVADLPEPLPAGDLAAADRALAAAEALHDDARRAEASAAAGHARASAEAEASAARVARLTAVLAMVALPEGLPHVGLQPQGAPGAVAADGVAPGVVGPAEGLPDVGPQGAGGMVAGGVVAPGAAAPAEGLPEVGPRGAGGMVAGGVAAPAEGLPDVGPQGAPGADAGGVVAPGLIGPAEGLPDVGPQGAGGAGDVLPTGADAQPEGVAGDGRLPQGPPGAGAPSDHRARGSDSPKGLPGAIASAAAIPSAAMIDAALAYLDELVRAVRTADEALRRARAERDAAVAHVDEARAQAAAATFALRSARDPLVALGAPAVDDGDPVAGWSALVAWARAEAADREAALPAARARYAAAQDTDAAAEQALRAAERVAEQRRREETAAARAEQEASGVVAHLERRERELAAALRDAPGDDEAAAGLVQIEALEHAAKDADAALRSARTHAKTAERSAAALEREVARAWEGLRAARDPLVALDAPAIAGDDLVGAWTELVAWAGAAAKVREEGMSVARQAAATAAARRTEIAQRIVDELAAHAVALDPANPRDALDAPTVAPAADRASAAHAASATADPVVARDLISVTDTAASVGTAAAAGVGTAAAASVVAADPASAATAVATVVERARGAHARIVERRAAAAGLLGDREAAVEAQQVAKMLGHLLRSDGFPRWLVASALDTLVADASVSLAELSGGQFELTHDNGEFLVVDHTDADARRPVKTLSGGETFQASLALALALSGQMSSLAARGGARLESIFLDEGFGTLDEANLETVASTLETLATRGDRVVGVITHVPALAERVPVRFVVQRDQRSSSVTREGV